jgi:hypothetical protein
MALVIDCFRVSRAGSPFPRRMREARWPIGIFRTALFGYDFAAPAHAAIQHQWPATDAST